MPAGSSRRCLMPVTGMFHVEGGIAAVNRLGLMALSAQGYDVDVMTLAEHTGSADRRYASRGAVSYQAFAGNKLAFAAAVWKKLLQRSYDLVLVDHVNIAAVLALPGWRSRLRYAVWLCGIEVFSPRPDREGRLGLQRAWKRLAISEYTRRRVAERFPNLSIEVCDLALDPVKHTVWPTKGQEVSTFQPITMEAVDGSRQVLRERMILHVGRMVVRERYKGQDVLLQAMPGLLQDHPDAQMVLAGHGDDRERLLAMARNLPAEAQRRIFMPGYVEDEILGQLYHACNLFAMPSHGEGFGLVYLEAMSRGKPCLGARVDAAPYVIRDGITGLLVENPLSVEQVTTGLQYLLSDPERGLRLGQAGYDLVQSHYLFEHFRERFYKALLA